jgi:hypothetical protein
MEITGRLTEMDLGRPLSGYIYYFPLPNNPHRENYERLTQSVIRSDTWGKVRPDGSFVVLGVPGPAVLVAALKGDDRFPVIDARTELRKRGVLSWPTGPTHALVEISPSEKAPKPLHCAVTLTAGRMRRGMVLGPDGRAQAGVEVAGLYASDRPAQMLKGAEFTLNGLSDGRMRVLIFLDPERKLGKAQEVRGGDQGPLAVRLEALGTLTGRVVDAEGQPLAGHQVAAFPDLSGKGYENLPQELYPFGRVLGIAVGGWYDFTGRRAVTDAEGRFRLEGLLPDVPYTVVAAEESIRPGKPVTHKRGGQTVGAGKAKDLGDWMANVGPDE